jgi:DtxR family transcriptional regulator, Mn-dependent transcriptional regulator
VGLKTTASVQDHLKALYHLGVDGRPVATNDLAAWLDVAPPSATAMLKRLAADGLVEHLPYHGARLTGAGEAAALKVVRRHRLTETFLRQVVGVPWDEVHSEAEILEHAISDRLEDRIDALLGHPTRDCHGDPIPPKRGRHHELIDTPLDRVSVGRRVRIERISDRDPSVLRAATSRGIGLGTELVVLGRDDPDGPTVIGVGVRRHRLRPAMARAISVTILDGGAS